MLNDFLSVCPKYSLCYTIKYIWSKWKNYSLIPVLSLRRKPALAATSDDRMWIVVRDRTCRSQSVPVRRSRSLVAILLVCSDGVKIFKGQMQTSAFLIKIQTIKNKKKRNNLFQMEQFSELNMKQCTLCAVIGGTWSSSAST